MLAVNSSVVRKNWSQMLDLAIREKPVLMRRNRDYTILCSAETIAMLVDDALLPVNQFMEEDGSVTLSAEQLDLVVCEPDLASAKRAMASAWVEYAEDYFKEFQLYSHAPNRKGHLSLVMKALTVQSPKELEGAILCRRGES